MKIKLLSNSRKSQKFKKQWSMCQIWLEFFRFLHKGSLKYSSCLRFTNSLRLLTMTKRTNKWYKFWYNCKPLALSDRIALQLCQFNKVTTYSLVLISSRRLYICIFHKRAMLKQSEQRNGESKTIFIIYLSTFLYINILVIIIFSYS